MGSRKQYAISDLLANSVQPFEDLDPETLEAMARGIVETEQLLVPIVITSDGVLVDGHQRLKVLQTKGMQAVSAGDIRVIPAATKEDALEWSIRLNVQRRHLTTEQKAAKALELRQTRRWSDGKIAELFGVSSAAVGQWLKGQEKLDTVVGRDGILQTQTGKAGGAPPKLEAKPSGPAKPWVDPWQDDGPTLKVVVRLTRDLELMLPKDGVASLPDVPRKSVVGDQQYDFCRMALNDLKAAISNVLTEMAKPEKKEKVRPKPPAKKAPAEKTSVTPFTIEELVEMTQTDEQQ